MNASQIFSPAALGDPVVKVLPLLIAFALLISPLDNPPLLAQGLESEEAIEAIIGSDVKTEEVSEEEQVERVVAAIENTRENAEGVRKAFSLDTLEIVFLPATPEEESPIEKAVAEHKQEIEVLRESIEGSAMFYHAIDSRSILLRDIVAVEFDDENQVTVFVRGEEQ